MNPYTRRLFKQLTADKKRLSLMLILMMVGLLLWGRLLIKKVPRSAVADPGIAASARNNSAATGIDENHRQVVHVNMYRTLTRDMFRINADHYELINPQNPQGDEAKLVPERPDDKQRIAELTGQARKLRLSSTLLGDPPMAMINGELVKLGQEIAGFTLREVKPRYVSVEKDGIVIKLEM